MKRVIKICILIMFVLGVVVLGINYYVIISSKDQIVDKSEIIDGVDCVIVLGAGIWDGKPSPMLEDRLLEGIDLYHKNKYPKIIMSGDHGRNNYDEVNIMKDYAIKRGVLSQDIFMDHAGFSTYDSIYRAKEIFSAKKVVIVTQKYHLYRALSIANHLGLEAYGINSDPRSYSGQIFREIREVLARNKDFVKSILKLKPKYLGEVIPVMGNGDITND